MRLAAVGHHNDINKLMFQLAKKTEDMNRKTGRPVVHQLQKFLV